MNTDKPLILIVEDSHTYPELLCQAEERGRNRTARDIEGPDGQAV
ncbi:MAG: hypothetical protein R3298_12065 [Gammaproteobacteria bacterium]|nr:hypothetical protein [Gammaproteobacteria bacterium]